MTPGSLPLRAARLRRRRARSLTRPARRSSRGMGVRRRARPRPGAARGRPRRRTAGRRARRGAARHAGEAPFLTALLATPAADASTPSSRRTTPVGLTSLGSGLPPGVHGITGLFMRRRRGRVAGQHPATRRRARPASAAAARRRRSSAPSRRTASWSPGGAADLRRRRADASPGCAAADYAARRVAGERVAAAAAAVRRGDSRPDLRLLRRPGRDRPPAAAAVGRLASRADPRRPHRRAARGRAAGAAPAARHRRPRHGRHPGRAPVGPRDHSGAGRRCRGASPGDLRGAHVHARPGAAADVLAAWSETLGDAFWVVPRDEAVADRSGSARSCRTSCGRGSVTSSRCRARPLRSVDSRSPAADDPVAGRHARRLTDAELGIPLLVHQA